jgi:lactam utilization protein B
MPNTLLEEWANHSLQPDIALAMDKNYKYDGKILSQNEELAKIRKEKIFDKRLEARVRKIEDDTVEMKMEIKVISVSTHFRFPSVLHCLTQVLKKKAKSRDTTTNPTTTAKYC